jgi:hypothetical protein
MNRRTLHLYAERLSKLAGITRDHVLGRNYALALEECAEVHTIAQKLSDGILQRCGSPAQHETNNKKLTEI